MIIFIAVVSYLSVGAGVGLVFREKGESRAAIATAVLLWPLMFLFKIGNQIVAW